ncbi:unannotated protein [freshwater metagenome]|uniref:Unannotated protein n=1 Tax=freshwater metagenome TaxID=449393 RepID=A0A6J7HT75_9ZZZZ
MSSVPTAFDSDHRLARLPGSARDGHGVFESPNGLLIGAVHPERQHSGLSRRRRSHLDVEDRLGREVRRRDATGVVEYDDTCLQRFHHGGVMLLGPADGTLVGADQHPPVGHLGRGDHHRQRRPVRAQMRVPQPAAGRENGHRVAGHPHCIRYGEAEHICCAPSVDRLRGRIPTGHDPVGGHPHDGVADVLDQRGLIVQRLLCGLVFGEVAKDDLKCRFSVPHRADRDRLHGQSRSIEGEYVCLGGRTGGSVHVQGGDALEHRPDRRGRDEVGDRTAHHRTETVGAQIPEPRRVDVDKVASPVDDDRVGRVFDQNPITICETGRLGIGFGVADDVALPWGHLRSSRS